MSTIRKLQETCAALERELAAMRQLLDNAEERRDDWVVLIARARLEYRVALDHDNKAGKQSSAALEGSYMRATAYGYTGTFAEWQQVLRPHQRAPIGKNHLT